MEEINIGFRSGHLKVIELYKEDIRGNTWICKCDCGNEIPIWGSELQPRPNRRANKSCGCMKNARDGATIKHGRIYNIWYGMNARCYNPAVITYSKYGAKGIRVCKAWREDFKDFLEWSLTNGYADDLTLDRIDPAGHYSRKNCRWVYKYQQSWNKKARYNSETGVSGVTINKTGGFRVSIKRKGHLLNLGTHEDLEHAIEVRKSAEVYFEKNLTFDGFDKNKVS